jgi:hypothetical protein
MKLFWKLWKDGWVVYFRMLWFSIITAFASIPLLLTRLLIPVEDSANVHWGTVVSFVLTLIWGPVALSIASMSTGYFSRPDTVQDSFLTSTPADSPKI